MSPKSLLTHEVVSGDVESTYHGTNSFNSNCSITLVQINEQSQHDTPQQLREDNNTSYQSYLEEKEQSLLQETNTDRFDTYAASYYLENIRKSQLMMIFHTEIHLGTLKICLSTWK
jgi:hypothetical protein